MQLRVQPVQVQGQGDWFPWPLSYYDNITQEKRLRLTSRFGDTLTTAETYEIQGFPERQAFGITVNLQRVEP